LTFSTILEFARNKLIICHQRGTYLQEHILQSPKIMLYYPTFKEMVYVQQTQLKCHNTMKEHRQSKM